MEITFFQKKNDAFDSALMASVAHNYIVYDGMDLVQEGQENIRLCNEENQETMLIKKDLLSTLSSDAHFVVDLICQEAPITPKTSRVTRRSVEVFLRRYHWNKKRIKTTLVEIQNFVFQLQTI